MSSHTRVPNSIVRDPAIGPVPLAVYAVVMSHVRGTAGVCWPSLKTIAHEGGTSVSSVQRAIAVLSELGLVVVQVKKSPTGRRNHYYLPEQGGSGQIDPMGEVTVTQEEEPLEEESFFQASVGGR